MNQCEKEGDNAQCFPILHRAVREGEETAQWPDEQNDSKKYRGYSGKDFVGNVEIVISTAEEEVCR